MIPVKYIHKNAKQDRFYQIIPKIKNLTPNTVMGRTIQDNKNDIVTSSDFIN